MRVVSKNWMDYQAFEKIFTNQIEIWQMFATTDNPLRSPVFGLLYNKIRFPVVFHQLTNAQTVTWRDGWVRKDRCWTALRLSLRLWAGGLVFVVCEWPFHYSLTCWPMGCLLMRYAKNIRVWSQTVLNKPCCMLLCWPMRKFIACKRYKPIWNRYIPPLWPT